MKFLACLLVVALLTLRVGSLSREAFVEPIQNFFAKTAQITDDEAGQKVGCLKPKRPSLDLALPAGPISPPPCGFPLPPSFVSGPGSGPLPGVRAEIFIPPELSRFV